MESVVDRPRKLDWNDWHQIVSVTEYRNTSRSTDPCAGCSKVILPKGSLAGEGSRQRKFLTTSCCGRIRTGKWARETSTIERSISNHQSSSGCIEQYTFCYSLWAAGRDLPNVCRKWQTRWLYTSTNGRCNKADTCFRRWFHPPISFRYARFCQKKSIMFLNISAIFRRSAQASYTYFLCRRVRVARSWYRRWRRIQRVSDKVRQRDYLKCRHAEYGYWQQRLFVSRKP